MSETFILIHSPLVGPFTWIPVAGELARAGYHAIVPSLLGALKAASGFSAAFADCVAAEVANSDLEGTVHLIAHSGAGFFMPALRDALSVPVGDYIFVDARLPKGGASLFDDSPKSDVQTLLEMAEDGWLPPWSRWFERDTIKQILPDPAIRQLFLAELSPIPLALFKEPTPVFDAWPDAPCAYLRLSPAYTAEAETARMRGWTVREVESTHLEMLVDPTAVFGELLEVRDSMNTSKTTNHS